MRDHSRSIKERMGKKQDYWALTGVQAALLLVIEYYGSPKSSTLCVPDLLLEAAHAPGDQNEPRISSATVAEGRPIIPETRASVKGFRNVQRAADPESIDRNSCRRHLLLENSSRCPNPSMERKREGMKDHRSVQGRRGRWRRRAWSAGGRGRRRIGGGMRSSREGIGGSRGRNWPRRRGRRTSGHG